MLHTNKTQSHLSLGLELFQDLYKLLAAKTGFTLLCKHFPQSSSMQREDEHKSDTERLIAIHSTSLMENIELNIL
jgi:hypothetical protein